MHLFYVPGISSGIVNLNMEESKHCTRVLRLGTGDEVFLTDGTGGLYRAKIISDNPKACSLEIVDVTLNYGKRNYRLHIAIAPTKNIDRFEWFIEKATEIGIDEITPIICEHSERKVVNTERLDRIIISAMKQSISAYHPVLNNAVKFRDFISSSFTGNRFIAFCREESPVLLKNICGNSTDYIILVGPEGDFSGTEVEQAASRGFRIISLGENRFRTETAGVLACHTVFLAHQ